MVIVENVQIFKNHIYTFHKCETCGKLFADEWTLKKDICTIHEGIKNNKCESCGNLFSEEGTLKKHIHTVLEFSKDYKCESCGKSFPDGGKLKRHIKRVHERMLLKIYN